MKVLVWNANLVYLPERWEFIFIKANMNDGTWLVFGSTNDHPLWPNIMVRHVDGTHVLLATLLCKIEYRAPSRCIHDPTF